jgi:hypothetical protein
MRILLVFLIFLILLPNALAQTSQTYTVAAVALSEEKTVDIYFGYTQSLGPSNYDMKMLEFNPPDWGNNSRMVASLIRIVEEQTGNPTLSISVNNKSCLTNSITASIGSGQYVADFLCTNNINTTGNYTIYLNSSKTINNVHYRAWFTYITDLSNQTAELKSDIALEVWKQFFALGTPPQMSSTEYYCENDTILIKNRTIEVCQKSKCENIIGIEKIKCDYGCRNNECVPPPWITYAIIFVLIIVASFIYILITHRS